MSRRPALSGAELVKALRTAGFKVLRQRGSHVSMEKKDVTSRWRTVVPMHHEIARGTLHDILKQTRLTRDDLLRLL